MNHLTNHRHEVFPMRTLSADELLAIWEAGRYTTPTVRSILLLSAVFPEERDNLATVPLGRLTALLLRVRAWLFGPTLNCLANCPACNNTVEISLNVPVLLSHQSESAENLPPVYSLTIKHQTLEFRLPTAADLLAANHGESRSVKQLASRLICGRSAAEVAFVDHELDDDVIAAIEKQVLESDPLSQIRVDMICPDCRRGWSEVLQVIGFLWAEIDTLMKRLLADVARLASRFGWSEREILALTPERRRCYLELSGA
jgi:hypothetical protein